MGRLKNSSKILPSMPYDTKSHVELTRLAAEIFKTQNSFRKQIEENDTKRRSRYLVCISDPLRVKWDLFVMVLAIYNSFSIPFMVAFYSNNDLSLLIIDSIIDFCFFLDIIFNFRTTYINMKTGEEVSDA